MFFALKDRALTAVVAGFLLLALPAGPTFASPTVLEVTGTQLPSLSPVSLERLAVLACKRGDCRPVPFQVDERTADNQWALPDGPKPIFDDPPGVFDENDLLLWMADDAGEELTDPAALPPHDAAVAVEVTAAGGKIRRWIYIVACLGEPPRSVTRYVQYDPTADLMRGARVGMGFRDGIPDRLLALGPGDTNLLDRFKIRARATLIWGLLGFSRDEGDLETELIGWQQGPIRIIRYQRQRVRLGWGIRSPVFAVYTFFTRDYAELPVALWLNHPPTWFFTDIQLDLLLDFRDLSGWQLELPKPLLPRQIGGPPVESVEPIAGDWFGLRGPQMTLLVALHLGESLQSVRHRVLYRSGGEAAPPEDVPGERPAVGYRLDQWEPVGAGGHALKAVAYALPSDTDLDGFMDRGARAAVGSILPVR